MSLCEYEWVVFLLSLSYSFALQETAPLDVTNVSETLKEKKISPSKLIFGFLGLGNMGCGILKNLLNSGHSVHVWNRTPDKVS